MFSLKTLTRRASDGLLYPRADGSNIPDNERIFGLLSKAGEAHPKHIPLLDHFFLRSWEEEKEWEWTICDAFVYIGKYPTGSNILVSEKLKNILSGFNIGEHHFYPAYVSFKDKKFNYFILKILESEDRYVDYNSSAFSLVKGSIKPIPLGDFDKKILNAEDYQKYSTQLAKEGVQLKFRRMSFKNTFDVMNLPQIFQFSISERLKLAMEDNGITGLNIEPIDSIEIVSH